ncbi:MAG TPA: tetratricopeptide repeat protein [Candidatus Methylomirabilis sp.]
MIVGVGRAGPWLAIALALGTSAAAGEAATAPPPQALQEARRLLDAPNAPGNVDRAIGLLQGAASPGGSAEVQALLAEAYYERGNALDDRDQAVQALETAKTHADRALALAPDHVRARYWRAMAMLVKVGRLRGAESFGLVRAAMRDLEVVAAGEPGLDEAGADRAMGKVYLDSPWWFMGDTEKAIEHLEAARKRAPAFLKNRLYLAEAYAEDGRDADALRELDGILNTPPRANAPASDQKEREIARRLAEKLRARLRKP